MLLKEFKEFAIKGNAIDLAVGLIIGVAFGGVVTSLVNDIIMPPIGLLFRGLDFKELFVALDGKPYTTLEQARQAGSPIVAYGLFINTLVNFLIVTFAVFLVIRQVNRFRKHSAGVKPQPGDKQCPFCKMTIPLNAIRCPDCTSDLKTAA